MQQIAKPHRYLTEFLKFFWGGFWIWRVFAEFQGGVGFHGGQVSGPLCPGSRRLQSAPFAGRSFLLPSDTLPLPRGLLAPCNI